MTEEQASALREHRDNLIDLDAEAEELYNTVHEDLTTAYEAWNEKLDENAAKLEHLSGIVDNYKNIIEIVGKDNLGISDATLATMRETQKLNANNTTKAAKEKLDANKAYLAELEAEYAKAEAAGD
jgi:chromosome segregation ATPase